MRREQTMYSVEEFACSPEVLEASEDLIRAAFSYAGLEEATEKKAKKIIRQFKNKDVH